jgi:hypothetical protein
MKYSFAIACLLSVSSAVTLRGDDKKAPKIEAISWLKETLPECPADKKRTRMDDCKTHVAKFPFVGATCKVQVEEEGVTLIMMDKD